jgi:hypothetical protein
MVIEAWLMRQERVRSGVGLIDSLSVLAIDPGKLDKRRT